MKWLPPLLAGILIGAALTFSVDLFLDDSPHITTAEWKSLQTRAQAQAVTVDQQQREIATKSAAISRLQAASAPTPAPQPTATPARPNPMANFATLLDTPAMKKMMAAQQERMIEGTYADLIAEFHFTPEERAQFVELLVAKQSLDMEMGLKFMKLSPEERKDFLAQQKTAKDKADAAIREFFNDDKDFATYTAYTEEQTQNYQLKALRPAMKFAGQALSAEQEKNLGDIIRSESKSFHYFTNKDEPPTSPEASARMLQDRAQLQREIATRAANILSPEQLRILQKSQADELQMMKVGFEMSQSMLDQ